MGWIVMARDECNDETRASDNEWSANYDGEEPDPHWMYD